ncbi:MAG: PAS domain S-box protein [Methanocellales archaeon]
MREYLKEHALGITVGIAGLALSLLFLLIEYFIHREELFYLLQKDILLIMLIFFTFPLFVLFGYLLDRKVMLEREARKSEHKYRELFENAYDLIFTIDLEGNFTSANKAALKLAGYTDEVSKVNIAQLLAPETLQVARMRIAKLAMGETIPPFEYEIIKKDGSRAIIELSSRAIYAEGKVVGVHCIGRDITEQKILRQKIADSERYLKNIIASSADAIIALDARGNIVLFNEAAERIFGYKREEVVGRNIVENGEVKFYKNLETARYVMRRIRSSPDGRVSGIEVPGKTKEGREIYLNVSISLLRNEKGEIIGSLGVTKDITEQKKLEKELRESKELLERTFNALNDAVFIVDANTIEILDCNPAASKIFGYTREEMLGRTTTFLHVSEATLEEFRRHLYTAVKERGFLSQFEFKMKRKDGTVFPTEHSVMPLRDDEGKHVAWVSVVRDITERKKLENELKKSHEELKKAYEELKELHKRRLDFTNMAAHELRTPLQPIIGYIDLLKDKINDPKLLSYLETMQRNAMRLRKLVDRLLELSKLDAGLVELELSQVNLNRLIRNLIDNYAPTGREFCLEIPENLVIKVDEYKLYQILDNLISNAVRYSNAEVKICVEERSDDYLFKVIDRGIGVSKEDQKRIFERFYLVNGDKLSRPVQRCGLGLAIVKSYVELHGGKIWVESEVGKGSTFYFTIPKIRF